MYKKIEDFFTLTGMMFFISWPMFTDVHKHGILKIVWVILSCLILVASKIYDDYKKGKNDKTD
jgi:cytochrome bd-type quinol oxidase subunit 2